MFSAGFEPTIPSSEWSQTARSPDRLLVYSLPLRNTSRVGLWQCLVFCLRVATLKLVIANFQCSLYEFYVTEGPLVLYECWNLNFGNAAVTFDTAHLQSSYFHRPSMYSPKLCRTRSQRWGIRMMPLAAPVLLMVRTERSTAEGLNPTCNCPIR